MYMTSPTHNSAPPSYLQALLSMPPNPQSPRQPRAAHTTTQVGVVAARQFTDQSQQSSSSFEEWAQGRQKQHQAANSVAKESSQQKA
jgi:hypothetical protein